ncbi:hypothetical protein KGF57_002086 [Candida theae]|uniref:Uncharacterized protein n=1 Tax=Candida theae TaxID=1198502 RepID=A0AAD5BG34_9ASCO|nr:uncharacterized protein KGF57_002086 [Candida theae]KAI5959448.1 hypothetical protein KGF57_002086 [Candida theae]
MSRKTSRCDIVSQKWKTVHRIFGCKNLTSHHLLSDKAPNMQYYQTTMHLKRLFGVGTGVSMYPECTEFELIYNCLIPISVQLRIEYLGYKSCLVQDVKLPDGVEATVGTEVESSTTKTSTTDIYSKHPDSSHKEDAMVHITKGSTVRNQKATTKAAKSDKSFKANFSCIEQPRTTSLNNKGHDVTPTNSSAKKSTPLPVDDKIEWDTLYNTKVLPLLPPFWNGQLPNGTPPRLVFILKEAACYARINTNVKTKCEDEIRSFHETLRQHLSLDSADTRIEVRNELESKIYVRIMSLYYIIMNPFPTSLDEEYGADRLQKFGKLANGTLRAIKNLLKHWGRLLAGSERHLTSINRQLNIKVTEIEEEIKKVLQLSEEIKKSSRDPEMEESVATQDAVDANMPNESSRVGLVQHGGRKIDV